MNTFKQIKSWYKLSNPHKGYLAGQFLTSLFANAIIIAQAVPNANAISSLTNMDYNAAIFWLLISLGCYFLYFLFWHFNYVFTYKQVKYGTLYLSEKLYNKLSGATEEGLNGQSMERLMMIFTSNIDYVVKFSDYITYQSCYLIRAFITIAIVCFYDWKIGLVMLALVILLYFWYVFLGKKVQKHTDNAWMFRDGMGEQLTDIVEGRTQSDKLNLNLENKVKYLSQVKKVVKSYSKRGQWNCVRKLWTYAAMYIIVTALTIYLASLTHANTLTLTLYLIIAPYLINIIDQAKAGYEVLYELQREDVSRLRIETVLNMENADIVSFSNNTTNNLRDKLIFSNITYIDKNTNPATKSGTLYTTNMEFSPNTITLIKGIQNCGKRSLFYLLRRAIVPTTGTITMDGINIYDFDKNTYSHNFSYATSKPYFYSESILDNLYYVTSSKKKIIAVCKQLGIHKIILDLPHGYDTNIIKEKEHFSPYLLFMLGLARALLSDSEWLCIYEFPLSLTSKQQEELISHIKELKDSRAVIIFSASDRLSSICDDVYSVQSGHVKKISKGVNK